MKGKTLIFALTFIVCGGTSSTSIQETTTTTQQETTTTTQMVNVNVDPAKFCEENPDNEQCQGYDQTNQGSGGMGSGGMEVADHQLVMTLLFYIIS